MVATLEHMVPIALLDEREADLLESLRNAERRLGNGRAQVATLEADVQKLETELTGLRQEELRLQGEIRRTESIRSSARRALDQGLGDPAAAERQLARCAEQVDENETAILELMERRDALTDALAVARQRHADAGVALEALRADLEPTIAGWREDVATTTQARAALLPGLPREILQHYQQLRTKRGLALSPVHDKACRTCGRIVPPMALKDVREHRLVACDGCGLWLYLPPEGTAAS